MTMESNQIMKKEKLGLFDIPKEALTIPCRNPNFIIFTFLTSLPLLFTMVLHEIILQQKLLETSKTLQQSSSSSQDDNYYYYYYYDDFYGWSYYLSPLETLRKLLEEIYHRYLQLGILYLIPLHLLELLITIATIDSASMIYAGDKSMSLKEMLHRLISKARFLGPLITSILALLWSSISLLGLIWLAIYYYITPGNNFLLMVLIGIGFIAFLGKYLEWSAIWNMGIVISILEEKHGDIALGVSAYFSRSSRRRGLVLMLIFFVWRVCLRLSCFYLGWKEGGSGILVTTAHVSLVCMGNVMKWLVCMVYLYDCKKRVLEKKVDVEDGSREVKSVHNDDVA